MCIPLTLSEKMSRKLVMEDNLSAGYEPCDIHYFYNTGASIVLDENFENDSTFVSILLLDS